MKKVFAATLVMFLGLSGVGNLHAQQWSWDDPIDLSSLPVLKEMTVNPSTGAIYGIDLLGNFVQIKDLVNTVPAVSVDLPDSSAIINDIAVNPHGQVFICTDTKVKIYDPGTEISTPLDAQPDLPEDLANPGYPLAGKYTHIAVG